MSPAQNMEKWGALSLFAAGRFSQNLKQLEGIGLVTMDERKHLAVLDATARGEPLNVAVTEARGGAKRIRVIDEPATDQRDRLEPPVRMAREAGHHIAVVHAPTVFTLEILADVAAGKRCRGAHALVAGGVGVLVVDAEQEGVGGFPGGAQGADSFDGGGGHGVRGSSRRSLDACPGIAFNSAHERLNANCDQVLT